MRIYPSQLLPTSIMRELVRLSFMYGVEMANNSFTGFTRSFVSLLPVLSPFAQAVSFCTISSK